MMTSSQILVCDKSKLNPQQRRCISPDCLEWNLLVCSKRTDLAPPILIARAQLPASTRQEDTTIATQDKFSSDTSECRYKRWNTKNTRYLELVNSTTLETLWRSILWNPAWVGGKQVEAYLNGALPAGCSRDSSENCGALRAISKLCEERQLSDLLEVVHHTDQDGVCVDSTILLHLVQRCINEKDITTGRKIYCLIVGSGLESDAFLGSHVIHMFELFESLLEARQVFSKLLKPNVFSWSAIISAHVKLGQKEQAIKLYHEMHSSNVEPDGHVFVAVLKACATTRALQQGKVIHAHIVKSGFESHLFVCNTLINMYVKCGSLEDGHLVFIRLPKRDVVTWSALIAGYAQQGVGIDALQLLQQMQQEGVVPNQVTFVCILKACSNIANLEQGEQIHIHIVESGFEYDIYVGNSLIDMYCKCENLKKARIVFDRLPNRDVATWNAMISGYDQLEQSQEAFQLLQQMQQEGIELDKVTFLCSLKVCSNIAALEWGKGIHLFIIESGFELDMLVGNTLIDMYGKCGSLADANMVFDRLPERDVVTWSSLIAVYALHGHAQEVIHLFHQMQEEGMKPNFITFICIVKACANIADPDQGRQIHSHIIEGGFDSNVFVASALIDLYGKNRILKDAHMVFERLSERDVAVWNTMMSVYIQEGHVQVALRLFQQMHQENIDPDQMTVVCILKACSSIAALEQGRQIHSYICEIGFSLDIYINNTLVDMYSKCGTLEDACIVFYKMLNRDVVTWNAMIAGFAQHGDYVLAFQYFSDMLQVGLKPNDVTFICLLSACDHVGMVDEGCLHFRSMINDCGIAPMLQHFNSLIDIFGHAGLFNEAEDLLCTIPFQSNTVGWTSLLCSCKMHGNVDLGKRCFDQVVRINSGIVSVYVLMSNIYADAGMWEDAERIRYLRRSANLWKKPAKAFIEIDCEVHEFIVGDKTHPRTDDIYGKLKMLSVQAQEEGYMQHLELTIDPLCDMNKEDALCGHCEKLALTLGLICTPQGTTIRIAKNLRVCNGCHNATKIISKLERREILIIDAYRIHHFKEGVCCCNDYY